MEQIIENTRFRGIEFHEGSAVFVSDFAAASEKFRSAVESIGWDCDYRAEPGVFFLPNPETRRFDAGFVFRLPSEKDGDILVVSPLPLSHLSDYLVDPSRESDAREGKETVDIRTYLPSARYSGEK